MSKEEIELLKEMQNNCLNASVYDDEKRLLKSNAITKALMFNDKWLELKDFIRKQIALVGVEKNYIYIQILDKMENLIKGKVE